MNKILYKIKNKIFSDKLNNKLFGVEYAENFLKKNNYIYYAVKFYIF